MESGRLTIDEAYAVLEPYYVAVQETFESRGANAVRKTALEVAPWVHDGPRHFAACATTGLRIVAAPELADLPEETVLAIFSHEFGHAVDYLMPAMFFVDDEGKLLPAEKLPDDGDKRVQQARVARMQRWEARSEDDIERTADAIAERFTGRVIGYSGPCLLQSFERGVRPRPVGLR